MIFVNCDALKDPRIFALVWNDAYNLIAMQDKVTTTLHRYATCSLDFGVIEEITDPRFARLARRR